MKKLQSMIILALLFPLLTVAVKYAAYALLPTSIWIDYESIEVADIETGQTTQQWTISRNVKRVSLQGIYIDNAFCDSGTPLYSEIYTYRGDALYQKGASTTITVRIPDYLPPGHCYWISNITVKLPYGITRELPEDIRSNIFLVKEVL